MKPCFSISSPALRNCHPPEPGTDELREIDRQSADSPIAVGASDRFPVDSPLRVEGLAVADWTCAELATHRVVVRVLYAPVVDAIAPVSVSAPEDDILRVHGVQRLKIPVLEGAIKPIILAS